MRDWILLAFVVAAVQGCPKNVMRGVNECMGPLKGYSVDQIGILELMSRPDRTSQLCTDGKIQPAFSCLNDLYNTCLLPLSRDSSRRLDLIINVNKWSQAMNTICDNIQYFRDHAECERNASLEYRPCAEAEMAKVSNKLAEILPQLGNPTAVNHEQKMEALLKPLCYFSARIRDCLRTPYDKYCPAQLTNLLVSTVENFMPPACTKRARSIATKGSYNYNHNGPYDDFEVIFGSPKIAKHHDRNTKPDEKFKNTRAPGKTGKTEAVEHRKSKSRRGNGSSQIKGIRVEVVAFVLWFSYFQSRL